MAHHQRMPRSRLENLSDSLSRLGTALDVTLCANLLRHRKTFRPRHGSLSHPTEVLLRLWVVSEILLARDENNREKRCQRGAQAERGNGKTLRSWLQ